MGNIITNTSRDIFGLNTATLGKKSAEKRERKMVVPFKSIVRGKGLYTFVKRMTMV